MQWRRVAVVAGIFVVVVAGAVVASIGFTRQGLGRATAGLVIAVAALVLTALKTGYDMVIAPGVQARHERRLRAEVRRENVAGSVRQRLGLRGSILVGRIERGWAARDLNAVHDSSADLAEVAQEAYHLAETINDAAAIHLGVLFVTADELATLCLEWGATAPDQWDEGIIVAKIQLIRERVETVQEWAHEVMGEPLES